MDTKYCSKCSTEKSVSDFYAHKGRSDGLSSWCIACQRAAGNASSAKLRKELITLLGGACQCGFSDSRALQVDHVNGGGSTERKSGLMPSHRGFLKKVQEHPGDYQLLCANCNQIKRVENKEYGSGNKRLTIPTKKLKGIGKGNAPAQRAALERARTPEAQAARGRMNKGKPNPKVAEARKGTKLVDRHWVRP